MKSYPPIQGSTKAPRERCHAFLKCDGSNIRFEWSKKRGWYKFGSRTQLIDHKTPILGEAVTLFEKTTAEPLERVFRNEKVFREIQSFVVFGEFFGAKSFAGTHEENDPKYLYVFDVAPHKKGILSPDEFLKYFAHDGVNIQTPNYYGIYIMGTELIEKVRNNQFRHHGVIQDPVEGIVVKGGSGHNLWMAKIKTNAYLNKLKRIKTDWQNYWE